MKLNPVATSFTTLLICLLLSIHGTAQTAKPQRELCIMLLKAGEVLPSYQLDEVTDIPTLRILRNAVFAFHGYRFKAKDLQDFFAAYSWYKPTLDNVDDLLDEIDRKNIALIQERENRLNRIASLSKPAPGYTDVLGAEEKQLVGMWHQSYFVASGYSERYIFFDSHKVIWFNNEMDCAKRLISRTGNWRIFSGFLEISWFEEEIMEGGFMEPSDGSCATDSMLTGGLPVITTIQNPGRTTMLISPVEETNEEENNLLRVTLGRDYWWKMGLDPFEGLR